MNLRLLLFLFMSQNKKLPADADGDTLAGEVSEDEEEQDDTLVINGDYKMERQNSRHGSIRRNTIKV